MTTKTLNQGGSRIFLVDVEASELSPMTGVMTEFGVVDLETKNWFRGQLWDAHPDPKIPAKPVPEKENPSWTIGYSQFDLSNGLHRSGKDAKAVADALSAWLQKLAEGSRIVLTSDNNSYDQMWMTCFYDSLGLASPFGFSGRRIGDYASGLINNFPNTSKWKQLRKVAHNHQSHFDAMGNAVALENLMTLEAKMKDLYPEYEADAQEIFKELRKK